MLNQVFYISSVILMLSLGSHALSTRISRGSCQANMTAVGDLNMRRYEGIWYPQFTYPLYHKSLPKCVKYNVTKDISGKYRILRSDIDNQSGNVRRRSTLILRVNRKGGKYAIRTDNSPDGLNMYVLDTDYRTYSIQYACIELEGILNIAYAVIMTRERMPSSEVIQKTEKVAELSGIDQKNMVPILQGGCPIDV
ncbi:PREDICTED: apolipoprotein D isoform X1 [Drosophila arizonae]|uniref:Apolipoprotein D isoform X1 n=1 Tax=Drosophila arizonae TaxID=7263 RepID=A0ABM1NQC2_DROAR|nr:PREDICTED: apolipoprotein D isoform X1 [Drosophila arizonae]